MKHFDNVLKVYAKEGLRSAEEWKTLGRDILLDVAPRVEAECQGKTVGLYSRDQTQAQPPSRRRKG
jgi:hypothetical protein